MLDEGTGPAISNIDAECALIGGLMIDNRLIDRVADIVQPRDFAEPLNGRLFTSIIELHSVNKLVTPVTLKPYFDGDEALTELGGVGFLAKLTGSGAAVIGALDMASGGTGEPPAIAGRLVGGGRAMQRL